MDEFEAELTRRRSPGWVRNWESRQLHAVALSLRTRFWQGASSDKEDWLLDCCISELEYRRRRALRESVWLVCSCELCVPSFPWYPAELEL